MTLTTSTYIRSYNSTGFALNKQDFIRDILISRKCDILFLQETFLGDENQHTLNKIHSDFIGIGKCGYDNTADIQKGRNKGGLGII